jgi:DNA-binding FadR family transcriptional regulator
VRLAAQRATDADVVGLEQLVRSLEASVDEPDRFSELDIAMHIAVCAAADNFLLLQFMNILSTLGRVSRERTGGLRSVRQAALRDHLRLLDAIRLHDPDLAEVAMVRHLDHVEEGLQAAAGPDVATPIAAKGRTR